MSNPSGENPPCQRSENDPSIKHTLTRPKTKTKLRKANTTHMWLTSHRSKVMDSTPCVKQPKYNPRKKQETNPTQRESKNLELRNTENPPH